MAGIWAAVRDGLQEFSQDALRETGLVKTGGDKSKQKTKAEEAGGEGRSSSRAEAARQSNGKVSSEMDDWHEIDARYKTSSKTSSLPKQAIDVSPWHAFTFVFA